MHCLREPAMALGSLLSVALSSTAGKQFHFTISGGFFYPLKFKIVLDMGYTSERNQERNTPIFCCWQKR